MFKLTGEDIVYIALYFEGFFFGIYSGIFALYLQYRASKKDANRTQNIVFYFMCALYVLSVAQFICDVVTNVIYELPGTPLSLRLLHIYFIDTTLFACCDFIAQFILIYRCWIVWGRNIRIVLIPSILAFAFLGAWLTCSYTTTIFSDEFIDPGWGTPVLLTSISLSLTVNALATGLIVFRIFKVFREVKATSDDQILGAAGGSKLRRIIFILIESGMALFSIQLARLVLTIADTNAAAYRALIIIEPIHEMLNGITPTIIIVRTAMGMSFDEEKSMEEVAIGSFHFASDQANSVPETGSIGIVDQDSRRDDDDIDIERVSNDVELVER